nr:uncharacterized protein LOC104108414 [Nicotiana tomentosiformis]
MNLEKWNLLEESILRQKSRAQWIQLGDSNSMYFATVMRERSQRKQIMELNSLSGRKISDNIFLAQEFVKSHTRKTIFPRCMIKIDLQKAYDLVEWIFLERVLDELVYPRQFTMWTLECVKTVNYSILINGESTTPFDVAKGLRQGDPISLFLFALAIEYLSRKLNELKGNKKFKYHPKYSKLAVTHLSFADDLLLFSRGDVESVFILNRCFLDFSSASGLQANKEKSSIYFGGVTQIIQDQILHQLGFPKRELPFKYLGIPMSTKNISLLQWQPLINKMVSGISSWTVKKTLICRKISVNPNSPLWYSSILVSTVCYSFKSTKYN